ncbi:hypothetical protein UP10_13890 [Bradyrhizobium sp. LTSPM299]|uniref:hypothetical protein n=1 Tax=Bradyrhizobium sp. LTSPM299 TaxID=1619233 RepID=UPI0005CA3EFF|nr:hypothetical protein [Bradyrhizobium sp. LTSPM299]KJC60231.1 hypothetical protein UP10_13890 [Bradyrhizobium sp. LTSPM299]
MNGCRRQKGSFIADRRGAVALEMPFIFLFMMVTLLIPISDMAIAGFQFISAWEALRAFGQTIQYTPPPDVTSASSWQTTALAKADSAFPITSIQLICGASACATGNTASPKYYSYSTTITLAPMVLRPALCTSTNTNHCSFTLTYTERFQ